MDFIGDSNVSSLYILCEVYQTTNVTRLLIKVTTCTNILRIDDFGKS